ncbi:MAG: hypothetical protein LBH59_03460 [Planctomycetaceae bacterium]|nr:hypothetical protein [Planctomycetaceae bacterium]
MGVGFALEQTPHVVALAVFSFLILKRLQHLNIYFSRFTLLFSFIGIRIA